MQNYSTLSLIKRFALVYIFPHAFRLFLAVIGMIVVAATTFIFAKSMQPIIDDVLIAKDMAMLKTLSIGLVILFTIKSIAMYSSNFLMEWIGQSALVQIQKELFQKLIHQNLSYFQKNPAATLTSRFIFDVSRLKDCFGIIVSGITRDITMIIGLLVNLFMQDWVLASFSLLAIPLIILPVRQLGRRMRKHARNTQDSTADLTHILSESLNHTRQVQIYTNEEHQIKRASNQMDDVFTHLVKSLRVRVTASPVMEFLGGIITSGVLLAGGLRVVQGDITAGAFMSFLTTLLLLYRPIKGVSNIHIRLQQGIAAAESIFRLLDTEQGISDKEDAKDFIFKKGEISIKNLELCYEEDTKALSNINLNVKAGSSIAFVGASGAGKSSLLNLIPRFYEPTAGELLIDGQNIQDVTQKSLRNHIALVSQEVALFNGTIKENIAYGNPEASDDDIIEAAKQAAAHEFIEAMEEGYNSQVGDSGSRLSGGQRQRIAIARAFLKNAPILLLDEATSALDNQSEQQIQKELEKLMKGRTTITVAHRLSTIQNADCIYVLDKGQIVEHGTHQELIKKAGIYAKLQQKQERNNHA